MSEQVINYKKEKLWTIPFIMLIVTGTVSGICFYMVNPTIAKYSINIGATVAVSGVITGLFSITALVARPFSGLVADRVNRKKLLITATSIMAVAAFGYSISYTVPMLIFFRVLHGIAFAFNSTATVTVISVVVPRSRLGEGVGYYGLANIIATAVGPAIGLNLGNTFGYSLSYSLSAALLLIAAVIIFFIPFSADQLKNKADGDRKKGISFGDLISLKALPIAILGGLFSMSNGIITGYIALLGDVRNISNIAIYFTVNAFVLLFIRPFAGRLADRKGGILLVIPAMILDGIALITLGHATGIAMIITAAVLKAAGQGAGQPTLQATCLRMLPMEKSGVASSTFYIGADVGQGLGPMIAGYVISFTGEDSNGYGTMFTMSSLIFVIGITAFLIYYKLGKNNVANK
jgi:MFS family permease